MKKNLLFVMLAFSMNIIAKNHQTNVGKPFSAKFLNEGIYKYSLKKARFLKMSSEEAQVKTVAHQERIQSSLNQIIDSIYYWRWDTISADWNIYSRSVERMYDPNNNLTGGEIQAWNGTDWENSTKSAYSWDSNHNQINQLFQNWDGGDWVNRQLVSDSYDTHNNLTSELVKYWDGSSWQNDWQNDYSFDANNNQIGSKYSSGWNGASWGNSDEEKYILTYDSNNNVINEIEQNMSLGNWVNSWQYPYTYNAQNNIESQLEQEWNGSSWDNSWLYSVSFDANNNWDIVTGQEWEGSNWVNSDRDYYDFDAKSNLISEKYQEWNGNSWKESYSYSGTFDTNNFMTSETYFWWNNSGTMIEEGDSTYYYFHTGEPTSISQINGMHSDISVYPNPNSGKFTISSAGDLGSFEIYSISGERIYSNQSVSRQPSAKIDLSNNVKGVYLIKMHKENQNYTGKIIIQELHEVQNENSLNLCQHSTNGLFKTIV